MQTRYRFLWIIPLILLMTWTVSGFAQDPEVLIEGLGQGAWLGVSLSDLTKAKAAELKLPNPDGVLINQVEKDSPAEKAGLEPGDVIVDFNGIKVMTVRQFTRMVHEMLPERTVSLVIKRNGASKTLSVTFAERPRTSAPPSFWRGREMHLPDMEPLRQHLRDFTEQFHGGTWPKEWNMLVSSHPRIGITLQSLNPQLGDYFGVKDGHGALIASVEKESPAEKAGLKAGDVIVSVDSKEVVSPEDVIHAVQSKDSGSLQVKVIRNHDFKTFTVTPEQPKEKEETQSYIRLKVNPPQPIFLRKAGPVVI